MQLRVGKDTTSVALLDCAFRNALAAFYVTESTDGTAITYISQNIERIQGYSFASLLVSPYFWRGHLHSEDAKNISDLLVGLREKTKQTLEYCFLDAQGKYRWIVCQNTSEGAEFTVSVSL